MYYYKLYLLTGYINLKIDLVINKKNLKILRIVKLSKLSYSTIVNLYNV